MMKNYFFAMSLGLGGVIWATQHAEAQRSTCAARGEIVERLVAQFGEVRQSIGIGANNAMMEMFAAPATGTWTILVTLPNGMTCLVASGESWERLAEELPALGDDA